MLGHWIINVAAALALSGLLGNTLAQNLPPPTGIRGTITAVKGDLLKVRTNRGENLVVGLDKTTQVIGVTLANIGDIKLGSYVGTAALTQADGSLKALEVHVFPPELAGAGDGNRPWDLGENSSMTNGSVGDLVAGNGRTLTVRYKGGERKIFVPEDVPIVNMVPGNRSLLAPGVKIVLLAKKGSDAHLTALFISAGKDGVTPPM